MIMKYSVRVRRTQKLVKIIVMMHNLNEQITVEQILYPIGIILCRLFMSV